MKFETLDQYIARGGQVKSVPSGFAHGTGPSFYNLSSQFTPGHLDGVALTKYFLSQDSGLRLTTKLTGLLPEEIIEIVGIFSEKSKWAGLPQGELIEYDVGKYALKLYGSDEILWCN